MSSLPRFADLDVARAVEQHGARLAPQLHELSLTVGRAIDFQFPDWILMSSLVRQFRPHYIVEVGRGFGNSTTVFLSAANELGIRMRSFDLSLASWNVTEAKLRTLKGDAWLAPGEFLEGDLSLAEPEDVIPDWAGDTLFYWDAHGTDLAAYILDRIVPKLALRRNLIVVHDVTDVREGMHVHGDNRFKREPFSSAFDELLPLDDWWQSRGTIVRSPGLDVARAQAERPEEWKRTLAALPADALPLIRQGGHWVYFEV